MAATAPQESIANGRLGRPANLRKRWYETENVFFFIPNIIGYSRILLAGASLAYMSKHPITCSILYCISCILDALDGYCARRFNQSTKFGAVLDMVTDRCTTACLLVYLSSAYPPYAILFQCLISLDLASHYMHMYAMMEQGSGSHKNVQRAQSYLLNLYYTNNKVLFFFCATNELFFVSLYLYSFPYPSPNRDPIMPFIIAVMWITGLPCAFKQIINFVQMARAAQSLVEGDKERRRLAAAKQP